MSARTALRTTIGGALRSAGPSRCAAVAFVPAATRATVPVRAFSSTKRSLAEVLPGPAVTQTNRAEVTLRRFWKTVNVTQDANGDYTVMLDKRNLKTPSGTRLVIPKSKRITALLIAHEWQIQEEVLKQHALPMTSLASRALDGMNDPTIRAGVIDALFKYLETDTILFKDETPRALVRQQKKHWDPLFAWAESDLGARLKLADGFAPSKQDPEAVENLRRIVEAFDVWQLAVYASKSFIIGLALVQGRLNADDAAHAAQVEVRSQIEQWGEVEDCECWQIHSVPIRQELIAAHDVDYQDIRRALGSVACSLISV